MGQVGKKMLAMILSALIVFPNSALAAEPRQNETAKSVSVSFDKSVFSVEPDGASIAVNEKKAFAITLNDGRKLESVVVSIAKMTEKQTKANEETNNLTLTSDHLSDSFETVSVTMDQWPTYAKKFQLTIAAGALSDNYQVAVSCKTETGTVKYSASIDADGNATVNGNKTDALRGSQVSLSVIPETGYRLKSLAIQYGTVTQTFTGANANWNGLAIIWNAEGESTVSGEIYDVLQVKAVIEEIPVLYSLTVDVDDGLQLQRPSSRVTSVLEGNTCEVRVSANAGYIISDFTIHYGKNYASWATGQTFLWMGNDRVQVREKSGEVWFVLPEMYDDADIYFTSDYDQNNIPVETSEGSRINIDSSCGETVARGDDAEFYISTTSDRYSVQKITLSVGGSSASASPGDGEIRVGNKNYEIEDVGYGEYILYVDNITEPIKVSATSSSSSSVDRPSLSISYSSHMKITKSVSSSRIDAGDDVTFFFTPDTNYQIDEITVKIGSNSRTVGAEKTSIRVGNNTYLMSRNSNGVVSLYLTDIEENVTVSGRAYYTTASVEPTNTIRLNTSSRSAFMTGYSDGTFRPENDMTRAEAVVMLYRMCAVNVENNYSVSMYSDVPLEMWCAQEINAFARAGITDQSTYFYPDQYVTRAELTEWLYRLMGSPSVSSGATRFSDISGVSNSNAIRYAASRGWINGYPDGTFRPYNYIARSEVATMMTRVLNRTSGGYSVSYKDVPNTYWAYRYIQLASSYV